ncbi:MAG: ORF6N domain-containing protein [Candidatus Sumerlaeia bacterium]|nr:ORF6N domain-containing protein [Candidatus Sumerlaeia bacterium]
MTDQEKGDLTVAPETIYDVIRHLRGQQVMLDQDLATLYGVETKVLNQAVKRNEIRFPNDFMFQLSAEEWVTLRSQSVTTKTGRGGRRTPPYAFTQEGVAMLSSVLTSDRAIQVNIEIMRAFVQFRRFLANQVELASKLKELESRFEGKIARQDQHTRMLFEAVRRLSDEIRKTPAPPIKGKRRIGFHTEDDENEPKALDKPKPKKRTK